MPQPSWGDIKDFCEIDGWTETKSDHAVTSRQGKKKRDHYRYRKVLSDGTVLRTRVSLGRGGVDDPKLWTRIWRHQLGLDSEDQFWEALRTREPIDREPPRPDPPQGPTKPAWLFAALVMTVGIPEAEVTAMSEEEALARWDAYVSRDAP